MYENLSWPFLLMVGASLRWWCCQISDLNETFYLAAADNDSKMFWMHTIAGVLRRLGACLPGC